MLKQIVECSELKVLQEVVSPSSPHMAVASKPHRATIRSVAVSGLAVNDHVHIHSIVCLLQEEKHQLQILIMNLSHFYLPSIHCSSM